MKNSSLPLVAALLLSLIPTLLANGNPFPEDEPLEAFAKRPNPVLPLPVPHVDTLLAQIASLEISDNDVKAALDELVRAAAKYQAPGDSQRGAQLELELCVLGRRATAYYTSYQRTFHSDTLLKPLKTAMEDSLVSTLKKLEWIAQRESSPRDDLFKAYYSTLRRYVDVLRGKMILNGKWTVVASK